MTPPTTAALDLSSHPRRLDPEAAARIAAIARFKHACRRDTAADSLAEISKALQISLDTLLLGKANRDPEPPVKNPLLALRLRDVDSLARRDQQILIEMIDALIARSQADNVAPRRGKMA